MTTPAELRGSLWLPLENTKAVSLAKKQLVHKFYDMGETEPSEIIEDYIETDGYLLVPRQYGLKLCNQFQIEVEDHTSQGEPADIPKTIKLRDYQEGPVNQIIESLESHYDVMFKARTAFGKTLTALYLAAYYGRRTLVIVDQDNLMEQWVVDAIKGVLGLTDDDVGVVKGDKNTSEGKMITVAMIQTLQSRTFDYEFYEQYGFVVFDESHTTGARQRSEVLSMFPATMRYYVSATPTRKDAGQKILTNHAGPIRVVSEAEHDRSAVYIIESDTVYSWYANVSPKIGRILAEISEDNHRNMLLAEALLYLYETGRDVLAMSASVEHLQNMKALMEFMGVPPGEQEMYTGQEPRLCWEKDPTPDGRPKGWEEDTEYTPVRFAWVRKKVPKAELARRKSSARILYATYGMFQKGVDEPRLSGGIDLTPRSEASQVHGRIKRGKSEHEPIWVTVRDTNTYRAERWLCGRLRDYHKDNAGLFEWKENGELVECQLKDLLRDAEGREEFLKGSKIEKDDRTGQNILIPGAATPAGKMQRHAQDTLDRIANVRRAGDSERRARRGR